MALADPQSVNDGTAHTLARTGQGLDTGTFRNVADGMEMKVSHTYGKRVRREVRLDKNKVVVDPLYASQNLQVGASVYLVVNHPENGFTVDDLKNQVLALVNNLTASTNANLIKVIGGES